MKTEQFIYKNGNFDNLPTLEIETDRILAFVSSALIENNKIFD